MLPDRMSELLTAYVDGELTPSQREQVARLVQGSPTVQALLEKLESDSGKLRRLPQRKPDPELYAEVMAGIQQGQILQPEFFSYVAGKRQPLPAWARAAAGAAIAASVLLLVGTGVYLMFFNTNGDGSGPSPVVKQPAQPPEANGLVKNQEKPKPLPVPKSPDPLIARLVEGTFSHFGKPVPPGTRVALKDLFDQKGQAELRQDLQKQNGVYLDLPYKNSARAVEQLTKAFRGKGIEVLVDAKTRAGLKKGEKGTFLVYAENVQPEELTFVLRQLGLDERQEVGGTIIKSQFDIALITALTLHDRALLSKLLGVEVNDRQATEKETGGKKLVDKAGGPKSPSRFAVLLPASADLSAGVSPSEELRRFLTNRPKSRPGTLQVVLVLSQT
jgi:hypothetical protein